MLRQAFVTLFSYAVAPFQYTVALIQHVAERFRTWLRGPEPGQGDVESEGSTTPRSTPSLTDATTISSYPSSENWD